MANLPLRKQATQNYQQAARDLDIFPSLHGQEVAEGAVPLL